MNWRLRQSTTARMRLLKNGLVIKAAELRTFPAMCLSACAEGGDRNPSGCDRRRKIKICAGEIGGRSRGRIENLAEHGSLLGYGIAHYADFYDIKHVLILGRCTSGRGGDLLLEGAKKVFEAEFPELLKKIELHLPDEKVRRVGQSVAAASLPVLIPFIWRLSPRLEQRS